MSGAITAISVGVAAGVGASALGAAAVTAGLVGVAAGGLAGGLSSSGVLGSSNIKLPDISTVINPGAQAALASRTDTGATVKLGSTVKDQRISGARTTTSTKSGTVDILGGLGGGGLSV